MAGDRVRCNEWLWFTKCLITPSTFRNTLLRHAFLSIESAEWFLLHSLPSPDFTCKGRHTHVLSWARAQWLHSPDFASYPKLLPRVWLLLHVNSYKEPLVRAVHHVETKRWKNFPSGNGCLPPVVLLLHGTPYIQMTLEMWHYWH